jgi:WhiB family redox-sensing transcriptional regulator
VSENWRQDAACRGMDPSVFFPSGGPVPPEIRQLCGSCPVAAPCLDYALHNESTGTWAGLGESDLKKARRSRGITADIPDTRIRRRPSLPRERAQTSTCNWCGTSIEPGELLCREARACDHYLDSRRKLSFWVRLSSISDRLAAMDPVELQAWLGVEWPYVHEVGHAKRGCPTRDVNDRQLVPA